jgi:ATP-binding cassette, subfamily B, bacterial
MKHIFRVITSAKALWKTYALIGGLTVLLSLMTLVMPLLSGAAIDEMQAGTEARLDFVAWLAFAIFALDFLQNVLSNWSGYLGDMASARVYKHLASNYYQHLLSMPQSYFDSEQTGKIINRLSRSIHQITNFMQMFSNNFLQFIFTTVFSLIAVAFISWQVAALLLLLYPIYIYMTFRSSPKWQRYQETKNKHLDIASGRFTEVVSQIKVVKNYLQEKRELRSFGSHLNKSIEVTEPQSKYWHKRDFQRRTALNFIFFGVFMLIFTQGVQGVISPGQAVALILYAMQIRIPIFTISFLVENTQRAIADSKDYFDIMDTKLPSVDTGKHEKLRIDEGEIVFENVSFAYEKNNAVLRKVNFNVPPGKKAALVGESGEGKTTIANLLMRLYLPDKGKIIIDGTDIATVDKHSLQRSIATVFQEPALFSGTIRENIAYANPKATDAEVVRAAKAANAHQFISEFTKGYDTEIGERGLKLSGGQKQRIAIARAILKNAPILLLDEATSSLDSRSEALVKEALDTLMQGKTTLVIAHRLSTIQDVDLIITLKGGTVDEVGSPRQLAKSGGLYQKLLELQTTTDPKQLAKVLKKYDVIEP